MGGYSGELLINLVSLVNWWALMPWIIWTYLKNTLGGIHAFSYLLLINVRFLMCLFPIIIVFENKKGSVIVLMKVEYYIIESH